MTMLKIITATMISTSVKPNCRPAGVALRERELSQLAALRQAKPPDRFSARANIRAAVWDKPRSRAQFERRGARVRPWALEADGWTLNVSGSPARRSAHRGWVDIGDRQSKAGNFMVSSMPGHARAAVE
jgi:hypothetical protein